MQLLTTDHGQKRITRAIRMLRRLTSKKVARTFFTDEKIFTVEPPINTQNNRVYTPRNKLKADIADDRLFVTRSHYSKSIMVSVGVSKLGKTTLHLLIQVQR